MTALPSARQERLARRLLGAAVVGLVALTADVHTELAAPPDRWRRIEAHGPWPPPAADDPSNRVFTDPAAVAFGRRMFHDSRLSANGYIACVSCHQTDRAWTDTIAHAQGLAPVARNTPTLDNAALQRWFGWTGASDSLWMASLRPLLDAREMGSSPALVAHVVRTGIGLACEYHKAFGRAPDGVDDETLMVDVAKAIAAFQRTLLTGRTPFDDYRDALQRGDVAAQSRYPAAARRGAQLFIGAAGCATCHVGALFSDGSFRALAASGANDDGGRAVAVRELASSRFNLLGAFNDAPERTRERAAATRALALESASARDTLGGGYRVPGLRNVAVTAPYFHDGSRTTLREAVRHGGGERLAEHEVDDLVAFLHTLTDAAGARRPRQWPGLPGCDGP